MEGLGSSAKEIDEFINRARNSESLSMSTNNSRQPFEECGTFLTYKVYNTADNTLIGETTELTYTHTGLTNGTEYCYYVTASYAEGESGASPSECGIPYQPATISITPEDVP